MNYISSFYRLMIGGIYLHLVDSWKDLQLTGITNSVGLLETALKVNRMNKTTYVINGSVKITEDFSDAYDVGMTAFYSPMGNNQYMKMPFSYAKSPLCTFWDGLYRRAFSKLLEECSTFPKQVDGEPLCQAFVKGTYDVTNYPMDKSHFSHQIYQDGLYKFEFLFTDSKTMEVSTRIIFHIKLY